MKFYFAPLEGVTGFTYRNVFADSFGGVDKYYAPFISPCVNDKLKGKEIRDILPENNSGKVNLVPQILTNRADYFIKATKQIMDMGYTKEININIGCPSGTVVAKTKVRDSLGIQMPWTGFLRKYLTGGIQTKVDWIFQ